MKGWLFSMQVLALVSALALFTPHRLDAEISRGYTTLVAPDSTMPKIFVLGENESMEDKLNKTYDKNILRAFDGDAEKAFQAWLEMMKEMESFSDTQNFDLKGLNAYATFYWDKKGNIKHIGYSLKAKSRYFKPGELDKFFQKFINKHKMTPPVKVNFQHTFTIYLPFPKIYKK